MTNFILHFYFVAGLNILLQLSQPQQIEHHVEDRIFKIDHDTTETWLLLKMQQLTK